MAEWVATRPILDICQRTEGHAGGGQPLQRWWDQVVPLQREEMNGRLEKRVSGRGQEQGE